MKQQQTVSSKYLLTNTNHTHIFTKAWLLLSRTYCVNFQQDMYYGKRLQYNLIFRCIYVFAKILELNVKVRIYLV